MKICLYGATSSWNQTKVQYIAKYIISSFPDVQAILVDSNSQEMSQGRHKRAIRNILKTNKWDLVGRIVYGLALKNFRQDFDKRVKEGIKMLPVPSVRSPSVSAVVPTPNGTLAQDTINALKPDLLIQIGAGILRNNIFDIPTQGTLNVHHGYLPLIRGGDSIFWAMLEDKPEWVGSSVHWIDSGIDTGQILARERLVLTGWRHPAGIFIELVQLGLNLLIEVLENLGIGGVKPLAIKDGEPGVYRSFIGGWEVAELQKIIATL